IRGPFTGRSERTCSVAQRRRLPIFSSTRQHINVPFRPLTSTSDFCSLTSLPILHPQSSILVLTQTRSQTQNWAGRPENREPHASARGFKAPACDLRLRLQPSLPPALNRRKRPSQITLW